jgi:hypothetical protein
LAKLVGPMQCIRILSNGLRTCKERLNARLELIPSLLSSRHSAAVTVLWTAEEAGHGRSTEGAVPRQYFGIDYPDRPTPSNDAEPDRTNR